MLCTTRMPLVSIPSPGRVSTSAELHPRISAPVFHPRAAARTDFALHHQPNAVNSSTVKVEHSPKGSESNEISNKTSRSVGRFAVFRKGTARCSTPDQEPIIGTAVFARGTAVQGDRMTTTLQAESKSRTQSRSRRRVQVGDAEKAVLERALSTQLRERKQKLVARERAARFRPDDLLLIMPQFQKDGIAAAAKAFNMPVEKFVAAAALFFATSRSFDEGDFEVAVLQAMDPDSWNEQRFLETAEHERSR